MAGFIKGDIVVVPFPFSDLSGQKRCPALVLANSQGNNLILCRITTSLNRDIYAISLEKSDFEWGLFPEDSYSIRTNKLFTAKSKIIVRKAGALKIEKMSEVIQKLVAIFD